MKSCRAIYAIHYISNPTDLLSIPRISLRGRLIADIFRLIDFFSLSKIFSTKKKAFSSIFIGL